MWLDRREAMKQSMLNDSNANTSTLSRKGRFSNGKSKSSSLLFNYGKRSLQRSKKKGSKYQRKRSSFYSFGIFEYFGLLLGFVVNPDEILTYEEVYYYHPRPNFKVIYIKCRSGINHHLQRPIVLIGPTNIGRHELRQRLMRDTERFAAAVPHTSRPQKDGEIDGIDYHFITRQMFEHDIKDGLYKSLYFI